MRMYPWMANVMSFDITMWPHRAKPEKRRYHTTPTPWIRRLRSRHSIFTSTNRYQILHTLGIDIIKPYRTFRLQVLQVYDVDLADAVRTRTGRILGAIEKDPEAHAV